MITLRNDIAVFGWVFIGLCWAMLLTFTWLMLTEGPPPGLSPGWAAAVLALFWLGGIGAARWACGQPRVAVAVQPGGPLSVEERFLLGCRRATLGPHEVARVAVAESRDSDGDAYFTCWLELRDGRRFPVAEGHQRCCLEDTAQRLRGALDLG